MPTMNGALFVMEHKVVDVCLVMKLPSFVPIVLIKILSTKLKLCVVVLLGWYRRCKDQIQIFWLFIKHRQSCRVPQRERKMGVGRLIRRLQSL